MIPFFMVFTNSDNAHDDFRDLNMHFESFETRMTCLATWKYILTFESLRSQITPPCEKFLDMKWQSSTGLL